SLRAPCPAFSILEGRRPPQPFSTAIWFKIGQRRIRTTRSEEPGCLRFRYWNTEVSQNPRRRRKSVIHSCWARPHFEPARMGTTGERKRVGVVRSHSAK